MGAVSVSLDESSSWTLTADTYISEFDGAAENVNGNGFTPYVDGIALEGTKGALYKHFEKHGCPGIEEVPGNAV